MEQSDLEEKKVQIALTGQLYSLAQHTIIWLGPKDCHFYNSSFVSHMIGNLKNMGMN